MRAVTREDLFQFQWQNNPKFSPDGSQVVYEVTYPREKENDNKTELWLANVDGSKQEKIAAEGTWNFGPVWSPDGENIAFLSDQNEGMQVWTYEVASKEAKQLTHFHYSPSAVAYHPDGTKVYALLPVAGEVKLWDKDTSLGELTTNPSHRTYDTLYYKFDGIGFNDGTRKQLLEIEITTKNYQMLTDGSVNIEQFSVAPTGDKLAFSTVDFEKDNPLFNGEIYQLVLDGNEMTKIYEGPKAASPAYCPSGKNVAFISGAVHQNLYVVPSAGGEAKMISEGHPGQLADMVYTDSRHHKTDWRPSWSNDGKYIYALSSYQGTNEVVQFASNGEEEASAVIGGARVVTGFSYDGEDKFVIIYMAPETQGKVSFVSLAKDEAVVRKLRASYTEDLVEEKAYFPTEEVVIDDRNKEAMASFEVVEPETYIYESTDGWKIHGFMIKPAGFEAGKKYPVVLDIHGGPHSMHGFTHFHQLQLYSAMGYAVIYVNPRGSSGYGEEFTKAVIGNYGTKDMEDILNGVDAALEKYDFLDASRVAVTGLSYGGYMTNWIVTQTDRFQVAISEGGICNWVSMNGTSDIAPGFIDVEFANKVSMDELWERSPLRYVEKVNTPILIVHSEDDLRVPMEQGEQFYSFIKRQNKAARFTRIPESSHVVLQNGVPDKKLARQKSMHDWLDEHLPAK